jgi:hypothetical protein
MDVVLDAITKPTPLNVRPPPFSPYMPHLHIGSSPLTRVTVAQGGMNDPTVDVADPRGLNGVDLKIDLSRHARPELWAKYQALAGSADPFKVSKSFYYQRFCVLVRLMWRRHVYRLH